MKKVFIDGAQGTTGLRIHDRLMERNDIELIRLPEELRKDPGAVGEALNQSDIAFLCLPDDAAREAVGMLNNDNTVILDTSTAHRTAPGWAYGFPELSPEHRAAIQSSHRIAVPGCHASGFIALVYPLIKAGVLKPDAELSCFSLTGYSGGGRKLKEMVAVSGIASAPAFCPIVSDFYAGMEVTVPLFPSSLLKKVSMADIVEIYKENYPGDIVSVCQESDEAGFLSAGALSGKDSMVLSVYGQEERMLLVARYDNLGKGASGAAVQCMNLVLGTDEETGLVL